MVILCDLQLPSQEDKTIHTHTHTQFSFLHFHGSKRQPMEIKC